MTQPLENIFERASRLSAAGQQTVLREIKKIIARLEAAEQGPEPQPYDYEPFPVRKRVAGLGEGTIHLASDFDDPLPDSFWLGEE